MPPFPGSRYLPGGVLQRDVDGISLLPVREPFLFEERPDNTLHRVISGDTLENLAEQFYNNALLFWVIADFQPEPLLDPSEDLETGSILVLPSVEYVNSKVLGSPEGARVIL